MRIGCNRRESLCLPFGDRYTQWPCGPWMMQDSWWNLKLAPWGLSAPASVRSCSEKNTLVCQRSQVLACGQSDSWIPVFIFVVFLMFVLHCNEKQRCNLETLVPAWCRTSSQPRSARPGWKKRQQLSKMKKNDMWASHLGKQNHYFFPVQHTV